MRAVVQRVARAEVRVGGAAVGSVGAGLLILLAVARGDDEAAAARLAAKIARLRIFERDGRLAASLLDTSGAALVVSQFTLLGEMRSGTRPDFSAAAPPELAEPLYERFCAEIRALGVPVEIGLFGARMEVELVNDGPVTLVLD